VPFRPWRDQVLGASLRDPAELRPAAQKAASVFEGGRSVRIRHPNGTDLSLALAGRKATVTIGEVTPQSQKTPFGSMASVPDGSVYVAVDESTADGTFVANRRSVLGLPKPLVGGSFTFRDGRLVRSTFSGGGAGFRKAYASAGAGRERPAFLEVGLDPSLEGAPMLEEAELGAVTVGIGGNVGFGGKTRVDFLSYLTLGGAELSVDGKVLARRGRIQGR
jgi:hypothetical protein